jgi:hypothetical protein
VPGGMLHNNHVLERIGGQPRQQIDPCLGCECLKKVHFCGRLYQEQPSSSGDIG